MDQHLSENETALQTLHAALQELEAAAKEYQAHLRTHSGGHSKSATAGGQVPQPAPRTAYEGYTSGLRFLDMARKVWQRLTLRYRG